MGHCPLLMFVNATSLMIVAFLITNFKIE
ncbi:hypothetical protein CNEO2_100026 [Clostridium neonatale]|nr:hypothetical protein CNEO2_100026 [Clostridium neonatale]